MEGCYPHQGLPPTSGGLRPIGGERELKSGQTVARSLFPLPKGVDQKMQKADRYMQIKFPNSIFKMNWRIWLKEVNFSMESKFNCETKNETISTTYLSA